MKLSINKKSAYLGSFIIFLGALLRLLYLSKKDLWFDEIYTILIADQAPQMWCAPLYYLLMNFWIKIFGFSAYALRLPSAIFSIASLSIFLLLGKKLFDKKTALLALLLSAINPFYIWYAQEARNYSMLLFLSLASSYCLYSYLQNPKRSWFISYILITIAAIYTSYFFILMAALHVLYVFIFYKPFKYKSVVIFPLLMFIPWIPLFWKKFYMVSNRMFWLTPPPPNALLNTLGIIINGYSGIKLAYSFSTIILLIILVFFLMKMLLLKKGQEKQTLIFCILLSIAPVILLYFFSIYLFPVYLDRYLLFFTPYFYLLIAWTIHKLRFVYLKYALILGLGSCMLISNIRYAANIVCSDPSRRIGVHQKKPSAPIADFLKQAFHRIDCMIFANDYAFLQIGYYYKYPAYLPKKIKPDIYYVLDPALNNPHVNTNNKKMYDYEYYEKLGFMILKDYLPTLLQKTKGNIFFIGNDFSRSGNLDENSMSIKKYLDAYTSIRFKYMVSYDGINIYIYQKLD